MSIRVFIAAFAVLLSGCSVSLLAQVFLQKRYTGNLRRRVLASLGISSARAGQVGQGAGRGLLGRLWRFSKGTDKKAQQLIFDRELPLLLELTALGLRAGLGFDQAFELYATRFRGRLAELCLAELRIWEKGLISREDGLKALAREVGTPAFKRFTTINLRGLRYGASINQLLLELAAEVRRNYRSEREEEVAKAPVKMLIPTGVLILPAMLLLVLGPIMLDLMGKL